LKSSIPGSVGFSPAWMIVVRPGASFCTAGIRSTKVSSTIMIDTSTSMIDWAISAALQR